MPSDTRKKVAIACQGGGSHAAYAAGVLRGLLASPRFAADCRLVALTGTSGGAMCAAMAWSALVEDGGSAERARDRLAAFWDSLKVAPWDLPAHLAGLMLARMPVAFDALPLALAPVTEAELRWLIERQIDFARLAPAARQSTPRLLVGATDVLGGQRVVFGGERVGADHLLASAALPPLFNPVQVDGLCCWDGLFTLNPPLRELTEPALVPDKPDEIWVVQLNPQRTDTVPRQLNDVIDRRNELAGNAVLGQELHFIDWINRRLADGVAMPGLQPITLRVLPLQWPGRQPLDAVSKMDRSPQFIDALMALGERQAGGFFEPGTLWPAADALPGKARLLP